MTDGADVWFGVLGPLEARVGDRPVGLHGPRQERVLAALLLDADRTVTVEALIDAVWEEPPATARRQVQDLVARLRRALTDAGAPDDIVTRQRVGYLLRLGTGTLDVRSFERLVARAGEQSSHAPEEAVATYRAALALWRGEALAGVRSLTLESAARGWEEQRLAAWEACLSLELAQGRHHQVTAELFAMVARHPFQESLVKLLMVALHRSGRRSDALAAFHALQQRMAAELGLDPGADLQQLRAELAQAASDPAGAAADHDAAGPPPAWHVVRQLPLDVSFFAGRDLELARLDAMLAAAGERPSAVVIPVLSGAAGVGKTALALHWAHQVRHRFPDGQLYVNLQGFDPDGTATDPAEAVRGFLEALQVPAQRIPATLAARATLFRSLLADRRVLVVLDNARDAEQVRPLLPGTPGCLVVVTSRDQLSGLVVTEGARPLRVDLLSVADAQQLLVRRLGADRVRAEPGAVAQVIDRCARLPLALTIVAARAVGHPEFPLAGFAAALQQARVRLDALEGNDPATDVRRVFSWSYRLLTPAAARLFRLFGLHPGPDIAAPAAASLAGVRMDAARPLLAELDQVHLIVERVPGRYTCHDLLRVYAAELAATDDSEAEQRDALLRVLDHYVHTAHRATQLLTPHQQPIPLGPARPGVWPAEPADDKEAMDWFSAELPVLLAVIQQAPRFADGAGIWQLAAALTEFLDRKALWHDQAATHQVGLAAARRHADLVGQAHAHRALGWAYMRLGRHTDAHAHLTDAVELFGQLGEHSGQADAHRNLGWVCERQGDHRTALRHDRRALDLYRKVGDRAGEARALSNLGWDYAQIGDYRQALHHCQQALGAVRETGNRRGEAATLDSLGFAHHHLGDHAEAIACFGAAEQIYGELGDGYNQADTLAHLGDTFAAAGLADDARATWQRALAIFTDLGHPDAEDVQARLGQLAAR